MINSSRQLLWWPLMISRSMHLTHHHNTMLLKETVILLSPVQYPCLWNTKYCCAFTFCHSKLRLICVSFLHLFLHTHSPHTNSFLLYLKHYGSFFSIQKDDGLVDNVSEAVGYDHHLRKGEQGFYVFFFFLPLLLTPVSAKSWNNVHCLWIWVKGSETEWLRASLKINAFYKRDGNMH